MKKYLRFFVVLLAMAASAFTVNHKSAKRFGNSYTYNLYGQPGQDDPVNLSNPANYTFAGTNSLICSGSGHRCGVENAVDNGVGHPDFTQSYTVRARN